MQLNLAQWVGLILATPIVGYSFIALLSRWQRYKSEGEFAKLSLERLQREVNHILVQTRFSEKAQAATWSGYRKFSLHKINLEAEDIRSFYLVPHDGKPLQPFEPGQYLTFSLNMPDRAKPLVRCYSLSDSPNQRDYYRVTIKKIPPPRDMPEAPSGLSSSYFHDNLKEGDILDVRAPQGHFCLDAEDNLPIVLVGGGIGITPVLSMLNACVEAQSRREIWFFLCAINSDHHVFPEHFATIAKENANVHFRVVYSQPKETDVEGKDYHFSGHMSVDLMKELLPSNNYDFYVCGPPPMMKSIVGGLTEWKVPEAKIHYEAFGPATVVKTAEGKDAHAVSPAHEPEKVTFARSGKTVEWTPASGSLLELAEANGIEIDFGCRAGGCATCLVAIKDGEVEYPITPDAAFEDGSCLTCVARPKTSLILDA